MRSITWDEFYKKLGGIDFEEFDLIVGIAEGGVVPSKILHEQLGIPIMIISISFRDENNNPRFESPVVLEKDGFPMTGKRILLVDDVSRSGKTIEKAVNYLSTNEVKTFVVNGKADYNLYDTKDCLRMPWSYNK